MMNRDDMMAIATGAAFFAPAFLGCALGLLLSAMDQSNAGLAAGGAGIAVGAGCAFYVRRWV